MTHPPPGNGPWRILILDGDPANPKWILTTVARPEDVRPARPGAATVNAVTAAWVALNSGLHSPAFTAMPMAHCWRIDEPGKGTQQ
jgi:hypothetical protein